MANITPPQVQNFLRGVEYPAHKNDIVSAARDNGAEEDIMNVLDSMPDREYENPTDVSREIAEAIRK